ncbi:MAG TPA: NAD-dependent epimerase [Verrucomicrobiota bacterium]|nr:NAD-dependent epimerase [Verrucomicrobiota bacterium]
MTVLVTGAAGFIGFHVSQRLLDRGDTVIGFDNLNEYYDVRLKLARLDRLRRHPAFSFHQGDLADRAGVSELFRSAHPVRVIHLAAQAGVRFSLQNPHTYVESNLVGFLNVLEGCRQQAVDHLVYASSSSVYGTNSRMPFSVADNVDHPVSLYAATKKANELMAHTYSHLYRLPTTGLRLFTVYGPWGRPDMAPFVFTRAILEGRPIDVFNHGQMRRDFTYIDDAVEGVVRTLDRPAQPAPTGQILSPGSSDAPFRIYNLGNESPVELRRLIELLELNLGKPAHLNLLPMQPGDVPATWADVQDLAREIGFKPTTPIERGVALFVNWYRQFYEITQV